MIAHITHIIVFQIVNGLAADHVAASLSCEKNQETAIRFEYFVLLDDINAEFINNNTNIM